MNMGTKVVLSWKLVSMGWILWRSYLHHQESWSDNQKASFQIGGPECEKPIADCKY